jgi:H+-transporting ATPase
VGYLNNPLSWAMEVAALLAIILLDYADFALVGIPWEGGCGG